ncbi:MAG: hypothetical protein PVJ14_01980 [Chromatiales bacterium]|jgi:hypothetical protein
MNRVGDKAPIPVVVTKMAHCHRGDVPCATVTLLPKRAISPGGTNMFDLSGL